MKGQKVVGEVYKSMHVPNYVVTKMTTIANTPTTLLFLLSKIFFNIFLWNSRHVSSDWIIFIPKCWDFVQRRRLLHHRLLIYILWAFAPALKIELLKIKMCVCGEDVWYKKSWCGITKLWKVITTTVHRMKKAMYS